MQEAEVIKKLGELQAVAQAAGAELSRIDDEIKMQTELLAQAKRDRDSASDTGDKITWGNTMDAIAAARKRIDELGTDSKKQKAIFADLQHEGSPLNKSIVPLNQEDTEKIEIIKNRILERDKPK